MEERIIILLIKNIKNNLKIKLTVCIGVLCIVPVDPHRYGVINTLLAYAQHIFKSIFHFLIIS